MASTGPKGVGLEPPELDEYETKIKPDVWSTESGSKSTDPKAQLTNGKKGKESKPTVGYFELFRFATTFDKVLMAIGIVGAIAHGVIMPLFVIIFGEVIDTFADPAQYCSAFDFLSKNETLKEMFEEVYYAFNMTCLDMAAMDFNQTWIGGVLWYNFTNLPPAEQEKIGPFLQWAYDSGFLNESIAICEQIINSQSEFLDKMTGQIIYFVIIGAASWLAGYLHFSTFGWAAENQIKAIRLKFFRNLIRQDVGWYDQQESGAVTAKFAEDIITIHKGIGDKCSLMFQSISAFIAGMVVAMVKGWELALVVLSLSPLLALSAVLMMKFAFSNAQDESSAYSKAGAIAQEVLGSVRTVASFSGQLLEVERYAVNLEEARKFGTRKGVVMGVMMGLVFFVIFGSYALGFWYGIQLINWERPGYSIGIVTTTFFAVIMGTFSLGMSVTSIQNYASARAAAYNVFEVIDRRPPIDAFSKRGRKVLPVEKFNCHIEFKNIGFRYPSRPDVPILHDVSLTVEPGSTVALVGPSGCGKSTVIQLLQRFYDPESGSVEVDGVNLKDYNVYWFRSLIGSVSQEPVLFGASIAENIRYGYPSVTMEDIESASKLANAHNFIKDLPNGYETLVGEQGAQLSGGQKQRIAIARALVRNPRILLLDEATSALDTESEAIVQDALDRARAGRTTIAIAHRLSTIMNADKIVVISAGRVCEVGTHAELLANHGIYAKLVEAQQGRDSSEIAMEFASARERRAALARKRKTVTDDDLKSPTEAKDLVPESMAGLTAAEKKKLEQELVKEHYSMKRIWAMTTKELPFIVVGTLASLVCGGVWPAFSIIFSQMMDAFTDCDPDVRVQKGQLYSLIFLAIGTATFIGFTLMMSMFSFSAERLVARIRRMCFHAMLKQETAWFDDDANSTGALASRLATKCGQVRDATGAQLAQIVQNVASLLAAIIIAFIYEWRITLIMLAFMPILIIGGLVQGKAVGDTATQDKFIEDSAKYLVQATTNIRTVTSLGAYRIFINLFNAPLENRHRREIIKVNIAGMFFGLSEASMLFAYSAAFYAGAQFIDQGISEFGDVFTALAAIMFSAFAVGQANAMAPDQRKAQLAVAEIFKLLDRIPEISWEETAGGTKPAAFGGSASFESVKFHYPTRPGARILSGLDLKVEPGRTVALVGASGGGKSTVIQLFERFYDPVEGTVKLDDADAKSLNLPWLRGTMSLVSQEPVLFDRTVAENISYGIDGLRGSPTSGCASMEEIEAAAKQANVHDFIMGLPDGYNTRVGERGSQLSGGQKQRVAIARALVRKPQLLLLDEATSALDSESEKVVQDALDKARSGRTVLVIAHRLSTVEGADVIVVIQGGAVCEMGTHDDLLAKKGIYYGLWSAQQLTR